MFVSIIFLLNDFYCRLLLFLLLYSDALVPAVSVQLGEPVTFTCGTMENFQTSTWLQWYKQSKGDTLKLIVMQPKNVDPSYGPEFATSRFRATNDGIIRNLTILRTIEQDEGMYHCALIGWTESTWTGTYLMVKGRYVVSGLNHFYTLTIQKHCKYWVKAVGLLLFYQHENYGILSVLLFFSCIWKLNILLISYFHFINFFLTTVLL